MPNIASAKKRAALSNERREANRAQRANLRTAVKHAHTSLASKPEEARAEVAAAYKKLDQAAAAGIVHKNTAARRKSRLAKKLNTVK